VLLKRQPEVKSGPQILLLNIKGRSLLSEDSGQRGQETIVS
jgi:hypothetical protein